MTAPTLTADVPRPALIRDLRRTDLVALTVNNVIGAGVFTMPAALAAGAGRASLAVLLLTILLTSMMALCLVEVASRFDRTGGPMIYASEAFGPRAGFVVGWLMYLSRLSRARGTARPCRRAPTRPRSPFPPAAPPSRN